MAPVRRVNPWSAKRFNLNFLPLEIVSRYRDSQLQVAENYLNIHNFNPFEPEFTIVIFIHYKPRIAAAIPDL